MRIYYEELVEQLTPGQDLRERSAQAAASKLVSQMMELSGERHFFGWWRRVARAERQAIFVTQLLDEQALSHGKPSETAYWCAVRQAIRKRTYQ